MCKEKDELLDPELVAKVKKITGFTPTELAEGIVKEIKNASTTERFNMAVRTPELAGIIYKVIEAENRTSEIQRTKAVANTIPVQPRIYGAIRPLKGLHTPTIAEIITNANQPDPTKPYFDTNSDHMRQINPFEPHTDFSGEFPVTVNPLKPGPKITGPA